MQTSILAITDLMREQAVSIRNQSETLKQSHRKLSSLIDEMCGSIGGASAKVMRNNALCYAGKYSASFDTLAQYADFMTTAANEYDETDSNLAGLANLTDGDDPTTWERFKTEFGNLYGLSQLLAGAGYIGSVYNFYQDFRNSKSWRDLAKTGLDVYRFLSGARKTFSNYMKIGNAVGTKTALAWWAKSITGLKPLGRASTAKNPFTRFANNLTNKTSPFNAQLKNVAGDFKSAVGNFSGAHGALKATVAWGGVALNGVFNYFSNKDEQAASNGTMSNTRVGFETVTETIVDTTLIYGGGIVIKAVVGAAVTAISPVALPGVAVVLVSGAVMAGVNAGVKALTGKPVTEWVSDAILDSGIAIGKTVGKAAKAVTKSVGNWFGQIFS